MSEKQCLLWAQERLIKQGEKCSASLLSVASRELGETESFMSNRMKNRAVGPAPVISLYLPGFIYVSASIFFLHLTVSLLQTGTIAFYNAAEYPEEISFIQTNSINHMKIQKFLLWALLKVFRSPARETVGGAGSANALMPCGPSGHLHWMIAHLKTQ